MSSSAEPNEKKRILSCAEVNEYLSGLSENDIDDILIIDIENARNSTGTYQVTYIDVLILMEDDIVYPLKKVKYSLELISGKVKKYNPNLSKDQISKEYRSGADATFTLKKWRNNVENESQESEEHASQLFRLYEYVGDSLERQFGTLIAEKKLCKYGTRGVPAGAKVIAKPEYTHPIKYNVPNPKGKNAADRIEIHNGLAYPKIPFDSSGAHRWGKIKDGRYKPFIEYMYNGTTANVYNIHDILVNGSRINGTCDFEISCSSYGISLACKLTGEIIVFPPNKQEESNEEIEERYEYDVPDYMQRMPAPAGESSGASGSGEAYGGDGEFNEQVVKDLSIEEKRDGEY